MITTSYLIDLPQRLDDIPAVRSAEFRERDRNAPCCGPGPRIAQGWIGTLISHEFDLENSCDAFDDFQDFFLERRLNGEVAMDLQRIGS